MKAYLIIPVALFYLTGVLFPAIGFGQTLPQQPNGSIGTLFLPVPDLVFGPNSTQAADLNFRYVKIQNYHDNKDLIIYNPDVLLDRIITSHLPKGNNLTVVFDSFFFLNRQLPQVTPQISNVTMNLSRILNPLEASDITQMDLSDSIILPTAKNGSGQRQMFSLPSDIEFGEYLVDVTVFFPESQVESTYSTRISIEHANMTKAI